MAASILSLAMWQYIQYLSLAVTTFYNLIATIQENKRDVPPGERIDIGGYCLHLYRKGTGKPTVILDHSLGGLDGYFLIDALAELTEVCIYDRAGYGYSDRSILPRNSDNVTIELDLLLQKANIQPPYILVGDSFGSYSMRLFAHKHREKIAGVVFVDGLHESAMLDLPLSIRLLKLGFVSGFVMAVLGSALGIVRVLGNCGLFEVIKPELNKFPPEIRNRIKRSFYRPKHWLTMTQEMWNLDASGDYLKTANDLEGIPVVNIKSKTFFKRNFFTWILPLKTIDRVRDRIHSDLSLVSTNYSQINASRSSHFIWLDEPELIVNGVKSLLHYQE